jgi:galactose-1-phosphate uridylyltransferase
MRSSPPSQSRKFLETEHFRATVEFRATHPVVISISAVRNISSVLEMSRDEVAHWYWFTNVVLRVLHRAFGTSEFAVLSSKLDECANTSTRSLPAVLVLDHETAREVGYGPELFWYAMRLPDEEGLYAAPPSEIIERVSLHLSQQAHALVSSPH